MKAGAAMASHVLAQGATRQQWQHHQDMGDGIVPIIPEDGAQLPTRDESGSHSDFSEGLLQSSAP